MITNKVSDFNIIGCRGPGKIMSEKREYFKFIPQACL